MQQRWSSIMKTFGWSNGDPGGGTNESVYRGGDAKRGRSTGDDRPDASSLEQVRKKLREGGSSEELVSSDDEKTHDVHTSIRQVPREVGAGRGRGSTTAREVRPGTKPGKRGRMDKSKTPRRVSASSPTSPRMVVSSETSAGEDTDGKERVQKRPHLESVFGTPQLPPPSAPQKDTSLQSGTKSESSVRGSHADDDEKLVETPTTTQAQASTVASVVAKKTTRAVGTSSPTEVSPPARASVLHVLASGAKQKVITANSGESDISGGTRSAVSALAGRPPNRRRSSALSPATTSSSSRSHSQFLPQESKEMRWVRKTSTESRVDPPSSHKPRESPPKSKVQRPVRRNPQSVNDQSLNSGARHGARNDVPRSRTSLTRDSGSKPMIPDVIYLNDISEPETYSNRSALYDEFRRCFPHVRAQAKLIKSNGGIIIYSIASEADLETLLRARWADNINGSGPPFGGVRIRHVKPNKDDHSVCFFAPREEPRSAIVKFFELSGVQHFTVDERPLYEGRDAAWRIRVNSVRVASKLIQEGLTVGMDKENREYCIDWRAYSRSRKCHRCQRRTGHVAKLCGHEVRCGHCGRAHETRNCDSVTPCCANCSADHAASSRHCVVFRQKVAQESHRLGATIPPIYDDVIDRHTGDPVRVANQKVPIPLPSRLPSLILEAIERVCSSRDVQTPKNFSKIDDITTDEGAALFVTKLAEGLDTLLAFPPRKHCVRRSPSTQSQ